MARLLLIPEAATQIDNVRAISISAVLQQARATSPDQQRESLNNPLLYSSPLPLPQFPCRHECLAAISRPGRCCFVAICLPASAFERAGGATHPRHFPFLNHQCHNHGTISQQTRKPVVLMPLPNFTETANEWTPFKLMYDWSTRYYGYDSFMNYQRLLDALWREAYGAGRALMT